MRFLHSLTPPLLLLLAAGAAQAASSWGFDDATISVGAKKADAVKEKFGENSPLSKSIQLGPADTLKVLLTAKENGKGKRPHQAFVVLREPESGLEAPFPLTVKDNGKATLDIKHTDLPLQLAIAQSPLKVSLVLASFGSSQGFNGPVFDLEIKRDAATPQTVYDKPLRYGKLDEIHHIFHSDPTSPPKIVSLVFALAVLATVPPLVISWTAFGGNLSHLGKAMSAAPVSHAVFFGSIVALEGVFYKYYTSWNLFQTLPAAGVFGVATFLTGTKALGEVQSRRLAGER